MTDSTVQKPLRLRPGVVIVVLQLLTFYLPGKIAPISAVMFYGMLGSLVAGTLLVFGWWLLFSRARWSDRLGGLALLIVVHAAAVVLADPSAKMVAILPGVPWLCAVFVASLFFRSRAVTVIAVLVASLSWTLVRTDGVTGTMDADYAWRWSSTSEQKFMASNDSVAPAVPATTDTPPTAAWSGFRGPARDSSVAGVVIDTDWTGNPPQEIWRRAVGPGWGSFTLVGNLLCTLEQRDQDEAVVCYDAATGEPVWLYAYAARFWESMGGPGPRTTPAYDGGRLYALGATGILNCLDVSTGALVWTRDITEDTAATIPIWAFSSSPLIVDDLVVVHAPGASDGRALVAYDTATGEPRWFAEAGGNSYSSPHLVTIDGARQIVMITMNSIYGVDAETGDSLWVHEWPATSGGERVVQPAIVEDGRAILIGTFDGGTRKLALSSEAGEWSAEEVWTSRGLKPYFNDLVVHRGIAFGFDRTIFAAIDVATGERAWKGGRYGNGQVLLLADQDLLLVLSEKGELVVVRAIPDKFDEVARIQVLESKTWNHPIVADGVIYVRNSEEAAAYRLPR